MSRRLIVYPFLAAVYSVLALAQQNLHQGIGPRDLAVPLMLSLPIAAFYWVAAKLFVRDPDQHAAVAAVWALGFLMYGNWTFFLPSPQEEGPRAGAIGLLASLAAAVVVVLLVRKLRPSQRATSVITVMLVLLLAWSTVDLAAAWIPSSSDDAAAPAGGSNAVATADSGPAAGGRPDVYLVILDAYSRADDLLDIYGHDNTGFEDALRERGFFVPKAARANYVSTYIAVAAMLGQDYVRTLLPGLRPDQKDRRPVFRLLKDNRTIRGLKEQGYHFVYFRSPFPPLSDSPLADERIPDRVSGEFELFWFRNTTIVPIHGVWCWLRRCPNPGHPFTGESSEELFAKFDTLAALASTPSPKFVFTHLLFPHEPFRVDARCDPIPPLWPSEATTGTDPKVRELYRDQVECANRLLLQLVDTLLARSAEPPVIIFQGDHGYARLRWGKPPPLEGATEDQVRERLSVFAAYHFPDGGNAVLYDSISPVNVFRGLFRHYFGEHDLQALPDQSFWSTSDQPFDLTPIEQPGSTPGP